MSLSFQGTLSHKAFDDLSQQQVQYEHVFNKYSISKTPATPLSPPMNPAYSTKIMTSAAGLPIPDDDYHHFSTGSGSTFVEDQNIPNENFQMSRYNSQIELIDK